MFWNRSLWRSRHRQVTRMRRWKRWFLTLFMILIKGLLYFSGCVKAGSPKARRYGWWRRGQSSRQWKSVILAPASIFRVMSCRQVWLVIWPPASRTWRRQESVIRSPMRRIRVQKLCRVTRRWIRWFTAASIRQMVPSIRIWEMRWRSFSWTMLPYIMSRRHRWLLDLVSDAVSLAFCIWRLFRNVWKENTILILSQRRLPLFIESIRLTARWLNWRIRRICRILQK